MKRKKEYTLPSPEQIKGEIKREQYRYRYRQTFHSTIFILIVIATIAVLLATLFFPFFRIDGSSMSPTVNDGDIVIFLKGSDFKGGDLVVLSCNNKLLVRRVIAGPGQWVDLDREGNVYVDAVRIEEPYLTEKAFGDCTIELPYQVPDNRYFVMGDNRAASQDSRSSAMGCIADEHIIGKAILRFWPFQNFGLLNTT